MKLAWEEIAPTTYRLPVVGGWVLCVQGNEDNEALVFIPDPKHEWGADIMEGAI